MQDKVALIAGGAGDIGAACARAYAHYGEMCIRDSSRKEYGGNKGIHPKSDKRGLGI